MSKPNAFQLMMKSAQTTDRKTKSGYTIIKGLDTVAEDSCFLLQFDGLSQPNPGISTGGAVLFSPTRNVIFERGEFIDFATNNQAEYTGLIIGIQTAIDLGIKNILIEGDSQLVILQTEGKWKVKHEGLKSLHMEVKSLLSNFDFIAIRHIGREKNGYADKITNNVLQSKKSYFTNMKK